MFTGTTVSSPVIIHSFFEPVSHEPSSAIVAAFFRHRLGIVLITYLLYCSMEYILYSSRRMSRLRKRQPNSGRMRSSSSLLFHLLGLATVVICRRISTTIRVVCGRLFSPEPFFLFFFFSLSHFGLRSALFASRLSSRHRCVVTSISTGHVILP